MSHRSKLQNLPAAPSRAHDRDRLTDSERAVLAALRDVAYGRVEVVVHSSRIVQITRSQKVRVDGDRPDGR